MMNTCCSEVKGRKGKGQGEQCGIRADIKQFKAGWILQHEVLDGDDYHGIPSG